MLSGCATDVVVERVGHGAGSVVSDPPAIDCGDICTAALPDDGLTLAATPAVGSVFVGWEGACTGSGPCAITVDDPVQVAARFELTRQPLDVAVAGPGKGLVTAPGIACGTYCSELYPYGATVTLHARPLGSARFAGWSGGCAGSDPTCTIVLHAPVAIEARFDVSAAIARR
ncbi:MAG TPA: hypothetical protein VFQ53_05195 [Kofleriaceae bacterium]|nr:hypothetical protein [Kofleriaceae bacterium]